MDENSGLVCCDCMEWFYVVYNNTPWNKLRFCPLCGYEFTELELKQMIIDADGDDNEQEL